MNPFQTIRNRIEANAAQKNEEQRQRIERLAELEATQNRKGFHIPNPVQSMKDKKEIKKLKKEIAAFEESKRNNKIIIGCAVLVVFLIGFCGIMAAFEKDDLPSEVEPSTSMHEYKETTLATTADTAESNSIESQPTAEVEASIEGTTPIIETTEAPTEETEPSSEPIDCLQLSASDLSVTTIKDYAHTDTDVIFLGNQEGVTISIVAEGTDVTWDALVLLYDETILNVEMQSPVSTETQTVLKAYVTGKKTGESEFFICTEYDLVTKGDNAEGYYLDIRKLDSSEGRIVYVTRSGEKYHFSESCAGDGATKTTYRDAIVYEYEPCGKCAG